MGAFVIDMDYNSKRWERKRARILRRDGYMCQLSKRYGKMVPADTVHHIFPVSQYPKYQWEDWNLISVSGAWHNKLHDRNSDHLTEAGMELMQKTARRQGIEI